MPSVATILHVSDLHFIEDLEEEGRRIGWRTRTYFAKSHSFRKLRALNRILYELHRQGKGYDFVLATGDLTTDGSRPAFDITREFLERDEIYRYADSIARVSAFGLRATQDNLLLVPGNHDRYGGRRLPLQRLNDTFEVVLGTPKTYPYVVGYRRSALSSIPTQPTLLFFVFDSTPPPTARFRRWIWHTSLNRIAQGHITDADCDWLERKAYLIAEESQVPSIDGKLLEFSPANCIRIAVLHHHPVVDNDKARTFNYQLTYMENYERFVNSCFKAGINLVLFGHQHLQYHLMQPPPISIKTTPFGPPHNIYFLCCPSTLEYSEKNNGFYMLHFDDYSVNIELYEWQNTANENIFAFKCQDTVFF